MMLELDFQTHEFLSHKILRVTIEDSGIGIPNEARQKLFQPFTQAQRMTGTVYVYALYAICVGDVREHFIAVSSSECERVFLFFVS